MDEIQYERMIKQILGAGVSVDIEKIDGGEIKRIADEILNHLGLTWEDLKGKRVLDLGCGNAVVERATNLFYADKGINITSLDIRKYLEDGHVPDGVKKYVVADAEKIPMSDHAFDLIVDHAGPDVLKDEKTLAELKRVLAPEGEIRFFPLVDIFDAWGEGDSQSSDWVDATRVSYAFGNIAPIPEIDSLEIWNRALKNKAGQLQNLLGVDYVVSHGQLDKSEDIDTARFVSIKKLKNRVQQAN